MKKACIGFKIDNVGRAYASNVWTRYRPSSADVTTALTIDCRKATALRWAHHKSCHLANTILDILSSKSFRQFHRTHSILSFDVAGISRPRLLSSHLIKYKLRKIKTCATRNFWKQARWKQTTQRWVRSFFFLKNGTSSSPNLWLKRPIKRSMWD